MKFNFKLNFVIFSLILSSTLYLLSAFAQPPGQAADLDQKVRGFLEGHRYKWNHENISEADGKVLFDLVLKNNYKRAIEIGTSTGHSAIWIAWALSKTGGKLITIEINEERYKMALENFKAAGLSDYIDARLADAHRLIRKLKGSFDFVFIDADKEWYKNYLKLLLPKLEVGGCFTAHDVRYIGSKNGVWKLLEHLKKLPEMETTIDRSSWSGISISYKRASKT